MPFAQDPDEHSMLEIIFLKIEATMVISLKIEATTVIFPKITTIMDSFHVEDIQDTMTILEGSSHLKSLAGNKYN
jgi:hypothetical protein